MELEKLHAFSQKYLPSKRFMAVIGGVAGGIFILVLISNYVGYHRIFNAKPPVSADGSITDVVARDSNGNGIPDWQESLYGLDPKGDGAANKAIIQKKEADANIPPGSEGMAANPTDAFSQQLLATVISLHQSGSLTPAVIANIAASVGDSVDAKRIIAPPYAMSDMTISKKSPAAAKTAYYAALKAAVGKHSGLGSELSIMAQNLGSQDSGALDGLGPIADSYTALAKEIVAIPAPSIVAQNALDLANASAEMGMALKEVQDINTDALTGMVGVDDYTKASDLSDAAVKTLGAYFAN